jgi:ribosome-associated protein
MMASDDVLLKGVLSVLEDIKAQDVLAIDVRGRCSFADWIVIATGTSDRHVKSIAGRLVTAAKQAGVPPLGVEGEREGEWVLVDLADIVVHVMLPAARAFYSLEKLWQVDGEPTVKLGARP